MNRRLNLLKLLEDKSHFLFGPRASGKSYLIHQQLSKNANIISLLDSDIYLKLLEQPSLVRQMILAKPAKYIVIDEIQRIPELLNEVHLLLEQGQQHRFLLTGSSARKLKQSDANMLAGRARKAELFPFCMQELLEDGTLDVPRLLLYGGMPLVYLGDNPYNELRDYVDTYLQEEIQREANVRNLVNFSRFLKVAAISNGQIINFNKLGSDAQVHPNTVREYFQILIDTLLAFAVEPWRLSKKRKSVQTSKYYFFDGGVANALCGTKELPPHSESYGRAFEQLVALELRAFKSYTQSSDEICFWRTQNQLEVDFIVGDHTAIEVKSSRKISQRHHKNLLKLMEEGIIRNFYVVSHDPIALKFDNGIEHLPLEVFVQRLWSDDLFA